MVICKILASCVGAILILHGESDREGCMLLVFRCKFVWREKNYKAKTMFVLKAGSWEAGQVIETL